MGSDKYPIDSLQVVANSGKTSSVTSVSVKLRNVMFGQVLISALMSLSRTRSVARLIFSTVLVRYVHRYVIDFLHRLVPAKMIFFKDLSLPTIFSIVEYRSKKL